MKIVLCCNYQWPHLGGIEIICGELKKLWCGAGHQVTWITSDIPPGAKASSSDNVRIGAWNILEDRMQINCPIPNPLSFFNINRIVREHDAINVHSLAPGVTTLVTLAALASKKPLVVSQQVGIIPLNSSAMTTVQEKLLFRTARFVTSNGAWLTFPSSQIRQEFIDRGVIAERTAVAPNAFNKTVFSWAAPVEREAAASRIELGVRSLRVLFVGRFVDKKGLHYVRQAAEACSEVSFTLVGSGIIDPTKWRLSNVRVDPPQPPELLRDYFAAHDLLLLPSVGEGWPLVICEAMACGLPCLISSDTFDKHDRDPEMFLIGATPDDFTNAIRKAASDREKLMDKRESIAAYAERTWDWSIAAGTILRLLEEQSTKPRRNAQPAK